MKRHTLRSLALAAVFALAAAGSARAQWTPAQSGRRGPAAARRRADHPEDGIPALAGSARTRSSASMYSLEATVPPREDFIVTKASWPHADFSLDTKDPESVVLKTSRLTIKVSRANSAMVFLDEAGKTLAQEDARSLTPVEVNGEKTLHSERFVNMWATQEAFYGLGQHQGGVWNYRGEAIDISQDNTNISVPFLLSSNGYGLFFNNGSRSRFNNRFVHAFYYSSEVADALDYYFIYGPDFDRLVAAYRDLTGQAPLFGKWAYGFWQCKNKYETQEQILSVAHKYREHAHPGRQHRPGLVLVDHDGRSRLRPEAVPRPQGDDRRSPQEQLPPDDLGLAVLPPEPGRAPGVARPGLPGHGQAGLLRRQDDCAELPSRRAGPLRRVQPRGAQEVLEPDERRRSSRSGPMPGGSTRPSPRPRAARPTSSSPARRPSATGRATSTCIRS